MTGELEALKREMARYGHDFDDLASTVGKLNENGKVVIKIVLLHVMWPPLACVSLQYLLEISGSDQ